MNLPEAVQLIAQINLVDSYAKKRTEDENLAIARSIVAMLPHTPYEWASRYVAHVMRLGNVPSFVDIAAAWQIEAQRRVEAVPMAQAPAEIEDDPVRWKEWEKVRRDALIQGANPDQATAYATHQIAGSRAVAAITTGRPDPAAVEDAKASVKAQVAAWAAAQREMAQDAYGEDGERA